MNVEKFRYQGNYISSKIIFLHHRCCRCSPITIHVPSQEFQHKKKCLFGNGVSKKPGGGKNKYPSLRKEDSLKLQDLLKQKKVQSLCSLPNKVYLKETFKTFLFSTQLHTRSHPANYVNYTAAMSIVCILVIMMDIDMQIGKLSKHNKT